MFAVVLRGEETPDSLRLVAHYALKTDFAVSVVEVACLGRAAPFLYAAETLPECLDLARRVAEATASPRGHSES